MKRLLFGSWMLIFVSSAISQEGKPAEERLHWLHAAGPPGVHTQTFSATSIVRDAPTVEWSPTVVHLKGNVEIKSSVPVQNGPRLLYMFIRADSAEYHEDTGAIDAHGEVHITFEPH